MLGLCFLNMLHIHYDKKAELLQCQCRYWNIKHDSNVTNMTAAFAFFSVPTPGEFERGSFDVGVFTVLHQRGDNHVSIWNWELPCKYEIIQKKRELHLFHMLSVIARFSVVLLYMYIVFVEQFQAAVTKRRGIGPIRTEISRTKLEKSCSFFKLLDLTALVSGKITFVYCQILEILGQKRHFFTI